MLQTHYKLNPHHKQIHLERLKIGIKVVIIMYKTI